MSARISLVLLVLFLLFFQLPLARAQVATGQYTLGTFDSLGPDSINVGNLNLMLTIPVIHKPGRAGTNFTYDLSYNGSIWNPSSGAWTSDQNWGWLGQTQVLTGLLTERGLTSTCQNHGRFPYHQLNNVVYTDAVGIAHRWRGSIRDSDGQCTGDVDTLTGTWTEDGQYYYGYPISDIHGNIINPPTGTPGGAGSYTDSNGNQISTDGSGHFTDTTGSIALTAAGTAPSNQTYTYTDSTGTSRAVVVAFHSYSIATNFGCSGITEFHSSSTPLIDTITLPDSSTYHFTYEPTPGVSGAVTGRLASLQVPAGGTITYTYGGANNGINCADGSALGLTRTMPSVSGSPTRTYTRTVSGINTHTSVVDATGNHGEYDFVRGVDASTTAVELYQTALSVTNGSSGTPLLAQQTCYNSAIKPCTTQALTVPITQVDQYQIWDAVTQNGRSTTYDAYLEPTQIDLFDFGSASSIGALLQGESRQYVNGLVTNDSISQGSSARQTTFAYDGAAPLATSGVPQHTGASGARGNLTQVSYYNATTSGSLVAQQNFTYDDTGSVRTATSISGATTTYGYDATNTHAVSATPNSLNGVTLATSATYDAYLGNTATATDANGTVTSVPTTDAFGRPAEVDTGNGATTLAKSTYTYTPTKATTFTYQASATSNESDIYYDAYGRSIRTATLADTSGNWYVTDTCYDGNGRVSFTSYPYKTTSLGAQVCSGAGAGYIYDALGRTTALHHGDSSSTSATFTYLGSATKKVDENGVGHIYQADGMGRTAAVCELTTTALAGAAPASCGASITGTGFVTSYTYGLGSVIGSQGSQTRKFYTDALGRITAKFEPEVPGSGSAASVYYAYTSNSTGMVTTRTSIRPNQTDPSQLTTTTTQYDIFGRAVSITYGDGTPSKTFTYDVPPGWAYAGVGSAKGRMTSAANSIGASTLYSYNPSGQIQAIHQCIPGWCGPSTPPAFNRSYIYDWAGNPATEQYSTPSGTASLGYTVNLANQLLTVTGGQDTSLSSLYSATTQTPQGPTAASLGNGITVSLSYDVFGRRNGLGLMSGSTPVYAYTAIWQGQRVTYASDSVNGAASYGYDDFNRLFSASIGTSAGSLGLSWIYDRYGNRLSQSASGSYTGSVHQPSFTVDATTNRLTTSGYNYYAAGNLMTDGVNTYAYDAEGNVTTVSGGTSASFTYDALNQRVAATINGTSRIYGFNANGQRATVWDGSGNLLSAQYYAGSEPLAYWLASDGHVRFQHHDWVGNERYRTTYTGTLEGSFTSLPFGDSPTTASGSDTDPYHYAGLDSDSADLNHATFREFSSLQGRWIHPDPYDGSYDTSDPQSMNRYAYVGNSPVAFKDDLGLSKASFPRNVDGDGLSLSYFGGGGGANVGGFGAFWDSFDYFNFTVASWGSYQKQDVFVVHEDPNLNGMQTQNVWVWNPASIDSLEPLLLAQNPQPQAPSKFDYNDPSYQLAKAISQQTASLNNGHAYACFFGASGIIAAGVYLGSQVTEGASIFATVRSIYTLATNSGVQAEAIAAASGGAAAVVATLAYPCTH